MNKQETILFKTAVAGATLFLAFAAHAAGSAEAGATKAAMCIGCHGIPGYQNSFPEIHKVPKISGQSDKYIASALTAYQKGERKHPTMRGMAGSLSEQDIADLAAYYSGHYQGPKAPEAIKYTPPAVAALLQKGACVSCHGANLSKPIDPSYPKIAGQHADYLYVALKAYTVEGNPNVGRSNGVMAGVAKQFKLSELKEMAKFIGGLEGEMATVPQSKLR
jgi:cytochrome c553